MHSFLCYGASEPANVTLIIVFIASFVETPFQKPYSVLVIPFVFIENVFNLLVIN